MEILQHIHNYLRYPILILLIISLYLSWKGWLKRETFSKQMDKAGLFTMIALHIQFVLGAILYATDWVGNMSRISELSTMERFFTLEHPAMMFIGIVLVTMGRSLAKRMKKDHIKYKRIALFFAVGFLAILSSIPFPFRLEGGSWF